MASYSGAALAVLAYGLQALTAALLASCLLWYARVNGRPVVALWGAGWALLSLAFAGSGWGVLLLIQGADPLDLSRIVAATLNVGGRFSGAALLFLGARSLATGNHVPGAADLSKARKPIKVAIAVGMGLGLVGTLASAPTSPAIRTLFRVQLPAIVVILAVASACWMVYRHGVRGADFGRGFLVVGLLAWIAAKLVLLVAGGSWGLLFVFADLFALFVVTVASVTWLLEEERARLSAARSDLARARGAIQAQLDFEESLADVSIDFINTQPSGAARAMEHALERLAPHLGARAGWYLDMRDRVLIRSALWSVDDRALPDRIDPAAFPTGVSRLEQGRPVRIRPDPGSWLLPPEETETLRQIADARSRVLVPCLVGGELAGIVGFDVADMGADEESDVRFKLVAEVFSALLARLRVAREEGVRRERIFAAFRALPDVVGVARLSDGVLVEVNRGFEDFFGWDREDVVGKPPEAVRLWPSDTARQEYLKYVASDGTVTELAVDLLARDGAARPVFLSGRLVDVAGEVCVLSIARDRTDILHLEEQLRQAQRLEAVGRLAGGIAHDFNNLLTVIGGEAEYLLTLMTEGGEMSTSAHEILNAQERGRDLTARLLAFARQQPRAPEKLELGAVVDGMESFLDRLLGARLELTTDVQSRVGVMADKSQLEQVIMNLVVNARDAIEDSGSIRITVSEVDLVETTDYAGVPIPEGRWAIMEVTDNGSGIAPEVMTTIFDPFFTTKEVGKGTGLGLSTVYGIAQQSGGHVAVESTLGKGASFRIYLPATGEESVDAPRAGAVPGPSQGATILVIEDDRAVRELVKRALEREGHTVLATGDGQEAMKTAAAWEGQIDLILSDVVMPGASGSQVIEKLTPRHPGARILFMTGFHDALLGPGGLPSDADVIRKPFSTRELVGRIRELLQEPALD